MDVTAQQPQQQQQQRPQQHQPQQPVAAAASAASNLWRPALSLRWPTWLAEQGWGCGSGAAGAEYHCGVMSG